MYKNNRRMHVFFLNETNFPQIHTTFDLTFNKVPISTFFIAWPAGSRVLDKIRKHISVSTKRIADMCS